MQQKESRARKIRIVSYINVTDTGNLVPPKIYKNPDDPRDGWTEDESAHPFFWKMKGITDYSQTAPSEIRWIWVPSTGEMRMSAEGRHSTITPNGISWDAVLRGFYFPSTKTVSIRPFFHPENNYDQWDEDHADLNADVQSSFISILEPILRKFDPSVQFKTNVDNNWLTQTTGRYNW